MSLLQVLLPGGPIQLTGHLLLVAIFGYHLLLQDVLAGSINPKDLFKNDILENDPLWKQFFCWLFTHSTEFIASLPFMTFMYMKILRRKTTTTSDSVALGGNGEDAASGGGVGSGSEGRGGFQESKSADKIHLPASVVAQVTPSTSVLESLSSSLLTTAIFVLVGLVLVTLALLWYKIYYDSRQAAGKGSDKDTEAAGGGEPKKKSPMAATKRRFSDEDIPKTPPAKGGGGADGTSSSASSSAAGGGGSKTATTKSSAKSEDKTKSKTKTAKSELPKPKIVVK